MTATSASPTRHDLRIEDDALVRGAGKFMDDPRLANLAHAVFVRSPHAHARIVSLTADDARKAKGVLAVLTAEDMKAAGVKTAGRSPPMPGRGGKEMIQPFRPSLAGERVCYVGEAVATVVAETRALAQDAADLVAVEYEELPAVVDVRAALKNGRAADSSRGAGQSVARLARPGAERGQRARGGENHRRRAACGAGHRRPPAHGGRLDGNARRHRRLRQPKRQLHALRLLAERRRASATTPPTPWACRAKSCA